MFAILILLAVIGVPIWALIALHRRVGRLEATVRELSSRVPVPVGPVEPLVPAPAPAPAEPTAEVPAAVQSTSAIPAALPGPMSDAATGPWSAPSAAPLPPRRDTQDRPIVLRADRFAAAGRWLVANWVYAVSALSLVFAGVFLVQYGMEKGLLPPVARVIGAMLLGLALIAGGEWIRRRWGDDPKAATAYLPSTFSGAGIVAMFVGVLAARQLYGLIGPEAAFAGLVAVAALAILLGWFHGPFLAAIGLTGAYAAPFLTGGAEAVPYWLPFHYALVAGVGLGIDTMRRWAWVSVLALALAYGGLWLLHQMGVASLPLAAALVLIAVLAVAVPVRSVWPAHDGPTVAGAVRARGARGWPAFPVRLALGGVAATSLGLTLLPGADMAAYIGLALLMVALAGWAYGAAALADLAALPAAGFLARLVLDAVDRAAIWQAYQEAAIAFRAPETSGPATASVLVGLAAAGSAMFALRSLANRDHRAWWAVLAAVVAPAALVALEVFWAPAAVMGAYPWALHGMLLAAAMAVLALRFARADGANRRRAAYAVLSCLTLIAFALFVILTEGALTVALAVLVVVAAALDRRFRLPEMGWFLQAAMAVIGWRLVVDPGLGWAIEGAPLWAAGLSFAAAVAAPAAALWLLRGQERPVAAAVLESGVAGFAALFGTVLISRWLIAGEGDRIGTHWGMTLEALPWLILMLVQLYRLRAGARALRILRAVIAAGAASLGLFFVAASAIFFNPVAGFMGSGPHTWVKGPFILDTLLVAYALPGVLLLAGAARLGHLPRWLRRGLQAGGVALAALYAGLEIRRLWQGPDLSLPGVMQGELYSYTLALMLTGAVLLYQAIARRSAPLRRVAMAVIALTVAKVFLIDASGLTGLTRVVSFLGLGLSLAALAWLNRWAAQRQG